jgi:predicted lipid-binding transport protein (Tim44 family)
MQIFTVARQSKCCGESEKTMKIMCRIIGVVLVSMELLLTTGCVAPNGTPDNTATGAFIGGLTGALAGGLGGGRHSGERAVFGALAGVIVGGLIGHMIDEDQQRRLQQNSPQTWRTIQHNDAVYQQQQQAARAQAQRQTQGQTQVQGQTQGQTQGQAQASPAGAVTPITVDDIKALTAAGVKKEAINQEINISKSKFSQHDIAIAQQANVDPAVIDCMRSHSG